ncbi:hypothetical protein GCM10023185_04580 [Hymenobacter saemangeumensis]|uniref:Secreted protein n=1 Tax=Hymenobacter saemangeumensis TaxID=1084522 RepID=A0ABP8I066_9BACT
MLRSLLALLLLTNYLLVVGAGMSARPVRVVDQPFAYKHRHDCQLRNTLRVACFDDCNGQQYVVDEKGERQPLQHLLSTLKSLDVHCLPPAVPAAGGPPAVFHQPEPRRAVIAVAVPPGYQGKIDLPPRRG